MRFLSFVFLIGFLALLGYFAYENSQAVTLTVFGYTQTLPVPLVALVLYLLGMFSGWFVVGMLKRSWQRVTEADKR